MFYVVSALLILFVFAFFADQNLFRFYVHQHHYRSRSPSHLFKKTLTRYILPENCRPFLYSSTDNTVNKTTLELLFSDYDKDIRPNHGGMCMSCTNDSLGQPHVAGRNSVKMTNKLMPASVTVRISLRHILVTFGDNWLLWYLDITS